MVKKIVVSLLGIVALFLAYVALKSPSYVVSRSITINAPVEKVFPYLNNSQLTEKWGPWREEDPDAKMSYSGPDAGVGSKASWVDGKKLGTGSATIVESVPNERVGIKLEYQAPMNMTQYAQYLATRQGSQTVVEWKVEGKNSFMGRLMCTFVNMDKMMGGFFEKGLSKLKSLAENS